ncbi:MAG: 2-hydroxyacyl-CoA dehydratase family protein [Oscillibacter sp.]|jgi:benzoyl-CoA reductase/2-hydroxyglutaryl-CoA dehydratase subunit BcrC/BadD/HgdB|nr:2-hydroxyacyl-CoA dehydratase family protein [Oscillibacter sp.]
MADKNHAMWKDLGMDLDTHDLLCAALPGAFGDVFMSQKNRPEGMDYFNTVAADIHGLRPAELIAEQKKGRKVFGTFCVFVPDEVVIAADGIVTGLCGGSQFWVPDGEKVLPTNTCPLIKASLGARLGKTCPFFRIADMYVGETTCDGKKKAYEILGEDVPMHIMHLPHGKRPQDLAAWSGEIRTFIKTVEDFTGNAVTLEKLNGAIQIVNAKRRALERLYNCRKGQCVPISGRDVLLIMQIAFFDDPQRLTQVVNQLCDELEERVAKGVSVAPKDAPRILLTGTPLAVPNWKMHNIIESSGAVIVCEENCTGTRYFAHQVREDNHSLDEAVDALTDRYLNNIHCACFTPNPGRLDDIVRLAREYHVDGVIDLNLKFCTLYDTEGYLVERRLKDEGIPVLGLETDYTDNDSEQLRTRVEAFLEMIRG